MTVSRASDHKRVDDQGGIYSKKMGRYSGPESRAMLHQRREQPGLQAAFPSLASWLTVGMQMLPVEVWQKVLRPCQVSRPVFTKINSHLLDHRATVSG